MSKIGNYVVGIQENPNYQFGWESAERGEPMPDWSPENTKGHSDLGCQRKGWNDYHNVERAS